jgi:hypothetical protein
MVGTMEKPVDGCQDPSSPVKHTGRKHRAAWPASAKRERKKRPATPVGMTKLRREFRAG